MNLYWFLLLCAVILGAPHIRQGPALIYTAILIVLAVILSMKG